MSQLEVTEALYVWLTEHKRIDPNKKYHFITDTYYSLRGESEFVIKIKERTDESRNLQQDV